MIILIYLILLSKFLNFLPFNLKKFLNFKYQSKFILEFYFIRFLLNFLFIILLLILFMFILLCFNYLRDFFLLKNQCFDLNLIK